MIEGDSSQDREFRKLIKIVGWSLKKAGIDYSLLDEKGDYVCTIKITAFLRAIGLFRLNGLSRDHRMEY